MIECHLREAVEEAVREERERIVKSNAPEIEKVNAHIKKLETSVRTLLMATGRVELDGLNEQPTAADALRAVTAVALRCCPSHSFYYVNMRKVVDGIDDLLHGHRDTPAAKAIIGDEPT
jgi:hypothetical protein